MIPGATVAAFGYGLYLTPSAGTANARHTTLSAFGAAAGTTLAVCNGGRALHDLATRRKVRAWSAVWTGIGIVLCYQATKK